MITVAIPLHNETTTETNNNTKWRHTKWRHICVALRTLVSVVRPDVKRLAAQNHITQTSVSGIGAYFFRLATVSCNAMKITV
jgi:hypothetical protein